MKDKSTEPRARPCGARWSWLGRIISGKLVLVFALAVALSYCILPAQRFLRMMWRWERIEKTTLSVLKSENLAFLVTDRVVTQIAVEIRDSSPLLGKRDGILIGTVTLYFGVDLKALDASCLTREGNTVVVTLPEPKELDFTVDPASFNYITKRSGLHVIADYVTDKDLEAELRQRIHGEALAFMNAKELLPTRGKIVQQLNDFSGPLSGSLDVHVEFR